MSYALDHAASSQSVHSKPEPFASLAADPVRRRFWLFELLTAPFQDDDERASYRLARKTDKTNGGVKVSKAWNTSNSATGKSANGHPGFFAAGPAPR